MGRALTDRNAAAKRAGRRGRDAPRALVAGLALALALVAGCTRGVRKPVEGEVVMRHTVESGETLAEIAADYYGDPGRAREIARFNEIDEEAELRPGRVVGVPMTPDEREVLRRREEARIPYNEGLDAVARGSFLDAAARFREALSLDPAFAEAHYNLGVTYQRMRAHDSAADALREAVKRQPQDADYRYALGTSYYHLGRYDDAAGAFEAALRIQPGHLEAQYSLALSLEKQGEKARARRAWERYLILDDSSEWAVQAREHLQSLE